MHSVVTADATRRPTGRAREIGQTRTRGTLAALGGAVVLASVREVMSRVGLPVRLAAGAVLALYLATLGAAWLAFARAGDVGVLETAPSALVPHGQTIVRLQPGGAAFRAGVRVGDVIVGLDGIPLGDHLAPIPVTYALAAGKTPTDYALAAGDTPATYALAVGDRPTLQVVRAPVQEARGPVDVELVLGPRLERLDLLGDVLAQSLTATLFFGLGLLVLLARPDDAPARIFFMATAGRGLSQAAGVWQYGLHAAWVTDLEAWPFRLAIAATLHLFLAFPTPHPALTWLRELGPPPIRRARLGTSVLYLVPLAVRLGLEAGPPGSLRWWLPFVGLQMVLALLALARNYRRAATPAVRTQLRWLTWATATGVTALLLWAVVGVLPRPVMLLVVAAVPVAIGLAILRHRLFEVDVIINRALVYGPVTVGLAVFYLAGVVALQQAFRALTGQGSELAIALSTLAIAALFFPVRNRVQDLVDRRFYRRKYDAAQTIAAFGESVRDRVTVADLAPRLIGVVQETMQPAYVSLWLENSPVGDAAGPFGPAALALAPDDPLRFRLIASPRTTPIDHLALSSPALYALRTEGAELLVPLVERDNLLGLLILGPCPGGREYVGDDRRLLDTLAAQAVAALRISSLVAEQRRDAQRIERDEQELRIARDVQQSLLPREAPLLRGWEIATCYQPARAVGGDFYDFLDLPGGRLGIVVGDVAGHGVPAALLMASTRGILRSVGQRMDSPGAVLGQVNDLLCLDIPPTMFVTCLCAFLDPSSGRLRYASAGHVMPYRRSCGEVAQLMPGDLPLGIEAGIDYPNYETVLEPGGTILFYTDGLVEARDARHEVFGFSRLARLVGAHPSATGLIGTLRESLAAFSAGVSSQEDDVSLVALRRCAAIEGNLQP